MNQNGATQISVFKVNPFEAKQTNTDTSNPLPERGIINGQIDWATSLTNQLNVLDITLTINNALTDIKGLKF